MGDDAISHQRLRIAHATRHIDFHRRGIFFQTTSLQDEVLDGFVVGILVDARMHHLTVNRDGALGLCLLFRGNEKDVVLAQGDVGCRTLENALHIDAQHFQRAVTLHSVHHSAVQEGFLGHALGCVEQRTNGGDVAAQLIFSGTEHRTFQFDGVFIAVENRIDAHRVAVGHVERVHIELTHVENGILATGFSHDAHRFRVGIARETARIFQQGADALVFLHFVEHRTLHLTRDFHQAVVGFDDDEVVVGETDVARLLAVEDIVIDINRRNEFVVAIDLDVTQRTDVADAIGHIEGVEHRGEGRQRVGSGRFHLVHHVHGDGTRLSDGEFHPTALISTSQRRTQARVGLFYGHSADIHGTETIDVHVSVGTH